MTAATAEDTTTPSQLPELSAIIWLAVKPLLKLFIMAGAILARRGILDSAGLHLFSKALFAIFYPALLLSKIAAAINPENIANAGTVVAVAIFYIAFGLVGGVAIRWVVGRKAAEGFRGGIVSSCMWGNWGDLPLAIIFSIAENPPFRPGESSTAIAYLGFFILVWNVGFFPLGGIRMIENDYKHKKKENENEKEGLPTHATTVSRSESSTVAVGSAVMEEEEDGRKKMEREEEDDEREEEEERRRRIYEAAKMTMTERRAREIEESVATSAEEKSETEDTTSVGKGRGREKSFGGRAAIAAKNALVSFATAPNLALVAGLVIGVTPPLRWACIKDATNPDPPLKFLLECCDFMGAAAVPLALVNLGAALSKLKLGVIKPKIVLLVAIFRLVVCPLVAILGARALANAKVVDPSDRMLMFVVMFMGCTPSATSNVFITQLYNDGEAGAMAAVLVAQYTLGVVSMVVSLTVILHSLF